MLSDKPKLVFTDLSGKVTLEARLPCQQIKQLSASQMTDCQFLIASQLKQQPKQTPEQQYLTALYLVGESKQ